MGAPRLLDGGGSRVLSAECAERAHDIGIDGPQSGEIVVDRVQQRGEDRTGLYPLPHSGSNSPIDGTAANTPLPLTSVETQAGVDAIHAKLNAFNRSGTNFTNWQAAFDTVRTSGESFDALALVTDGNPTRISHPAVLQDTADNPATYELAGDAGVTQDEFAQIVGELAGAPVEVQHLTADAHRAALAAAGLPEAVIGFLVSTDTAIADGELADPEPGTLSRLIGRPTTPLRDTIAEAFRN